MGEHPIQNLMSTAMNSIKDMIDVNTIIGEPIQASNSTVIIPISKVGFGFAAGGSEFKGETLDEYSRREKEEQAQYRLPFGGGAGAGVSISPVAFLVVQQNSVKLLPVDHASCLDRLMDYMPDLIEKVNSAFNKQMQNKKEEKQQNSKCKEKETQNSTQNSAQENTQAYSQQGRAQIKPRKNVKFHKPVDNYEFVYDETGGYDDNDFYQDEDNK